MNHLRVYCSIPGTEPGPINGQNFEADPDGAGLRSVGEVSAENIENFRGVPGYYVEPVKAELPPPPADPVPPLVAPAVAQAPDPGPAPTPAPTLAPTPAPAAAPAPKAAAKASTGK